MYVLGYLRNPIRDTPGYEHLKNLRPDRVKKEGTIDDSEKTRALRNSYLGSSASPLCPLDDSLLKVQKR